ncbi:hypothetical protein KJ660_00995, partial [Candidatus Micrarchaeota archaeon]|nr:hypothetical protein [Candidatus Micrarchaeota archaeon]
SLGVYLIAVALIVARFSEGVHATLEMLGIAISLCLVILFFRKPFLLIAIIFGLLVFNAGADIYQRNMFQESGFEFTQYVHTKPIIGFGLEIIPQTQEYMELKSGANYLLTCEKGRTREIHFSGKMVRCDELGRVGAIGKKVYENHQISAYLIESDNLINLK